MSLGIAIPTQGLLPAYMIPKPLELNSVLPIGGQVGTGAKFSKGQALGVKSVAVANEVRTLTLASTPSGTVTVTLTFADGVYQVSFAFNATLAAVQAAFIAALPGWNGAITVTGTPGSSYVITFGGYLASMAIGGNWQASITSGTASWARTTAGSSTCQYDVYNSSTNNDVDAFVRFDFATDYTGARITEIGADAYGQPAGCPLYGKGIFTATDLVGLDSNAYTLGKLIKKAGGNLAELL